MIKKTMTLVTMLMMLHATPIALAGGTQEGSAQADHAAHAQQAGHAEVLRHSNWKEYAVSITLIFFMVGFLVYQLTGERAAKREIGSQMVWVVTGICSVLIVSFGVISFNVVVNLKTIGDEITEVAEVYMPLTEKMTKVTEHQFEQSIALERFRRLKNDETNKEFHRLAKLVDKEILEAEAIAESGLEYAYNEAERETFLRLGKELKQIEHEHKSFNEHSEQVFIMIQDGAPEDELHAVEAKVEEEMLSLNHHLEAFLAKVEHKTTNNALKAEYHEIDTLRYMVSMLALCLVTGVSLVFFARRQVVGNLNNIVSTLATSADAISGSTKTLAHGSEQMANGTTDSASSLEETASSVEELSAMVNTNATNAKEAGEVALKGQETAERGEEEIKKLILAMGEISTSSKKIEEIIEVIDDIAFQTNLLALNAAVEAARAGEQGKGFAVVAEAVRSLALRSAQSAKQIGDLIKDSAEKAENGVRAADSSGQVLSEIVQAVKKVNVLVEEVSQATAEQARGIEQLNSAVTQIQSSTQQSSAMAEEFSAISREIANQSKDLDEMVKELDVAA